MLHFYKHIFNASHLKQLAKMHPAVLCIYAYLGIPFGIVLSVFALAYIVLAPFSFLASLL